MAKAPDTKPGTIWNWTWFAFTIGVVGVVFGLWTQTQFGQAVAAVIVFFWQCIVVVISAIPDVVVAIRDAIREARAQ